MSVHSCVVCLLTEPRSAKKSAATSHRSGSSAHKSKRKPEEPIVTAVNQAVSVTHTEKCVEDSVDASRSQPDKTETPGGGRQECGKSPPSAIVDAVASAACSGGSSSQVVDSSVVSSDTEVTTERCPPVSGQAGEQTGTDQVERVSLDSQSQHGDRNVDVTHLSSASSPVSVLEERSDNKSVHSSPRSCRSDDMHYRKLHLLADSLQKKDSPETSSSEPSPTDPDRERYISPSRINVHCPVTDQIAKLKGVRGHWDDPVGGGSDECAASASSAVVDVKSESKTERERSPPVVHIRSGDDSRCSSSGHDDRRPASQASSTYTGRSEEAAYGREATEKASASSPLLVDKRRPVEPYRDPELLKKDSAMRHIHSLHQAALQPRAHAPVVLPTSYPTAPHPATLPTPHPTPQSHPLVPHLAAAAYGHHLNPITLQQQMAAAAASSLDRSSLSNLGVLVQQQHVAHLQQMQMLQQQLQLERIWQQKYPTIQVPPAWMLLQYQEELLRDVNLLHSREHLAMLEREREIAHDRERIERAAERERLERERAERQRAERERLEKERMDR